MELNSKVGRVVIRTLILVFLWLGLCLHLHLNYHTPLALTWVGFALIIVSYVFGMIKANGK